MKAFAVSVTCALWVYGLSTTTLVANAHESKDWLARTCATISNNAQRLRCYDDLYRGESTSATLGDCREMEMLDLQLDLHNLEGACVVVSGNAFLAGNVNSISRSGVSRDQNQIFLMFDSILDRESERQKLICNGMCRAEVRGVVSGASGLVGIHVSEFVALK